MTSASKSKRKKPHPRKSAPHSAAKRAAPSLNSLTPAELAKLLAAAGSEHAAEKTIAAHIKQGAPSNPDGSLNFLHYTAWMLKELNARKS